MFWSIFLDRILSCSLCSHSASVMHPTYFVCALHLVDFVPCVFVLSRAGSWVRVRARGYYRGWERGAFLRSHRQLFRQDDRTPITLLSLPIARVSLYSFASMPMFSCQPPIVTMILSNHPTYANHWLAIRRLRSAPLIALLVAGEVWRCLLHVEVCWVISHYINA